MIETKEQYEHIQSLSERGAECSLVSKDIKHCVDLIEALREVARGANQQRWISVTHPQLWNEELGDALDALPDWITEE